MRIAFQSEANCTELPGERDHREYGLAARLENVGGCGDSRLQEMHRERQPTITASKVCQHAVPCLGSEFRQQSEPRPFGRKIVRPKAVEAGIRLLGDHTTGSPSAGSSAYLNRIPQRRDLRLQRGTAWAVLSQRGEEKRPPLIVRPVPPGVSCVYTLGNRIEEQTGPTAVADQQAKTAQWEAVRPQRPVR